MEIYLIKSLYVFKRGKFDALKTLRINRSQL